jgi:hypothetical protein
MAVLRVDSWIVLGASMIANAMRTHWVGTRIWALDELALWTARTTVIGWRQFGCRVGIVPVTWFVLHSYLTCKFLERTINFKKAVNAHTLLSDCSVTGASKRWRIAWNSLLPWVIVCSCFSKYMSSLLQKLQIIFPIKLFFNRTRILAHCSVVDRYMNTIVSEHYHYFRDLFDK